MDGFVLQLQTRMINASTQPVLFAIAWPPAVSVGHGSSATNGKVSTLTGASMLKSLAQVGRTPKQPKLEMAAGRTSKGFSLQKRKKVAMLCPHDCGLESAGNGVAHVNGVGFGQFCEELAFRVSTGQDMMRASCAGTEAPGGSFTELALKGRRKVNAATQEKSGFAVGSAPHAEVSTVERHLLPSA